MVKRLVFCKMNIISAKQKIFNLYAKLDRDEYESLSKKEYKELFYAIRKNLPSKDVRFNTASKPFLYYGALKFCKFSVPTSYTYNDDDYNIYKLFTDTFVLVEGDDMCFSPLIKLYKLKWDLYKQVNFTRVSKDIDLAFYKREIEKLEIRAEKIKLNKEAADELLEHRNKFRSLINGLETNTLQTKISTFLPYRLTENNSKITICKDDVIINVSLKKEYIGNIASMIKSNAPIEVDGNPRWQTNVTSIDIVVNTLIDDSAYVDSILFTEKFAITEGWNNVYDFTYNVIEKLWWNLKNKGIYTFGQHPSPKDIPSINYSVYRGNEQLEFKLCSNPSYSFTVKNHSDEIDDLGEIDYDEPISLSKMSFFYATSNMELGHLKEALFWLNVAAEALLYSYADTSVEEEIKQEIKKELDVYEDAKSYLLDNYPDYAKNICWPDKKRHRSIFSVIKILFKNDNSLVSYNEVKKLFSRINKKRNKLFHGEANDINIIDIQQAYDAYILLEKTLL